MNEIKSGQINVRSEADLLADGEINRVRGGKGQKRRGAPRGNMNARKGGIYTHTQKYSDRFGSYTKTAVRYNASEEVGLARAMLMNVLEGKMPLGDGELEDPETGAEYALILIDKILKGQDTLLRQTVKQEEQRQKNQQSKGITVNMSDQFKEMLAGAAAECGKADEQTLDAVKEKLRKQSAIGAGGDDGS